MIIIHWFKSHSYLLKILNVFQTVNENSLKQLSSYLESLQHRRSVRPISIKFYLRSQADKGKCFELFFLNALLLLLLLNFLCSEFLPH